MTTENISFGQAERFQVALRWVNDDALLSDRPAAYGWSMGHVTITVAGVSLTASRIGADRQEHVGWYLGPALSWLARHWTELLHEESFGWPTKDAAPAAIVCRRALAQWVGSADEAGRCRYQLAQAWYRRHGLRSAAAGGLFPDLFLRRVMDDVEVSWTGAPPPFAPEGLSFESGAGVARLAVADVADPLWQMLLWVADHPPPTLDPSFKADWERLCARIDGVAHLSVASLESAAIPAALLSRVTASFKDVGRTDLVAGRRTTTRPFLETLSPAVAMFGGLTPNLSDRDITALRDNLVAAAGGADNEWLAGLVADRHVLPVGQVPYKDGYGVAEELLEDLQDIEGLSWTTGFVDVSDICHRLGIEIRELQLDSIGIRGVALAGEGFDSRILLNLTSPFNNSDVGKRFTIAHELCHVLHDRSRARRIAHSSGPWAAPGIEKRANAFAAYLLMPPKLLRDALSGITDINSQTIRTMALNLRVGEAALVEHLFNQDLIDEATREMLRPEVGSRGRA